MLRCLLRGLLRRFPGFDIVHRDVAVVVDVDLTERFRQRLVPGRRLTEREAAIMGRVGVGEMFRRAASAGMIGAGRRGLSKRRRTEQRQQQQSMEQAHWDYLLS